MEYPDYQPINNITEKPLYDEAQVNDQHQVLGEIIRQNWELIHPLARDYMLSAAIEWRRLILGLEKFQAELVEEKKDIEKMKADYELRIQRLVIEKDAQIAKLKEDVSENFREMLEKKEQELQHYKMLTESVQSSFDETKQTKETLSSEVDDLEQKIKDQEAQIVALEEQLKNNEKQAEEVQAEISANFQKQTSELSTQLSTTQEQNENLRDVLGRAKTQLVGLKEQNEQLVFRNKQFEARIETLERMIIERDQKIKQVVQTLNQS